MSRFSAAILGSAFWLLFAAPTLWLAHKSGWAMPLDTDAAMRLAQVRDLLSGQSWFDTAQHRMNVPFGLSMHWSRLVDAPLALLIRLTGETFALAFWPVLMLLPVLVALARIAERLGGHMAAITVVMLGLMAAEIDGQFSPGNIDHHNVQLALMLWMLVFVVEQRPKAAAVATVLGIGIGLESLPYVLAAIAAAALWLKEDAKRAGEFGLWLAGSATGLLLAATAAQYRLTPACDTYSIFYALLLMTGGAGLAVIARLPRHKGPALAVLAVAVLGLAALLNPVCLAGPYGGMDPRLHEIFLSRISEAASVWRIARNAPSDFVGAYVYACFALIGAFFAPRGRTRLLVIAFAAVGLAVASFQIRGSLFAILFALPGLAAALSRLPLVPLALGLLLGSQVSFAVAGVLIEGRANQAGRVEDFTRQVDCNSEARMGLLRALPPGRVAAFVDQGPSVLVYTRDGVIAGPYHRDSAGILDSYAIFAGSNPRAVLKARGIDYVMTCTASPDWDFYRAKGGLVAQLAAHRAPAWLKPAGQAGNVAVYRLDWRLDRK